MKMRFLSLCSGIEAASVAWNPLGWETTAVSEIEPFCCELLSQRHPGAQNLGNLNEHEKWPKLKPELIVAGTPCQAFSVAGLRRGLSDPRGGLMLRFLEVVSRERPRYVLWENVAGVLTSNRGRDFGTLLWSLAQLGYGVAYRVLDAAGFGVPQRRRRVFALGCLGDWKSPCKVLFEPEGMPGDTEKVGKKSTAAPAGLVPDIAGCLDSECGGQKLTHQTMANGHVVPCLTNGELVPRGHLGSSDKSIGSIDISNLAVRRLTPIDCERLQGFPDDYTRISYRKKPVERCPEGPRYKALGNSMAVPVMRWIAQRIQMLEEGSI